MACLLFISVNIYIVSSNFYNNIKRDNSDFIYDVFKNPSIGIDWKEPCKVLNLAIKCLKYFIDLDDLPQA